MLSEPDRNALCNCVEGCSTKIQTYIITLNETFEQEPQRAKSGMLLMYC